MKKLLNVLVASVFVLVLLQSFEFDGGSKRRKDGTEPGYTGSPGDSFKNCTACHGGTTQNVDGWIVSNIPSTGWVPGERYTITATNTKMGATRFGFEVSPFSKKKSLLKFCSLGTGVSVARLRRLHPVAKIRTKIPM